MTQPGSVNSQEALSAITRLHQGFEAVQQLAKHSLLANFRMFATKHEGMQAEMSECYKDAKVEVLKIAKDVATQSSYLMHQISSCLKQDTKVRQCLAQIEAAGETCTLAAIDRLRSLTP